MWGTTKSEILYEISESFPMKYLYTSRTHATLQLHILWSIGQVLFPVKKSYLADTSVDPNFPACLFLSTSPLTSDIHSQGFIIDVPVTSLPGVIQIHLWKGVAENSIIVKNVLNIRLICIAQICLEES